MTLQYLSPFFFFSPKLVVIFAKAYRHLSDLMKHRFSLVFFHHESSSFFIGLKIVVNSRISYKIVLNSIVKIHQSRPPLSLVIKNNS